jgi:hypothetical protein
MDCEIAGHLQEGPEPKFQAKVGACRLDREARGSNCILDTCTFTRGPSTSSLRTHATVRQIHQHHLKWVSDIDRKR